MQCWYVWEDLISIGLVRVRNVIGVQLEGFLDDTIMAANYASTNAEYPWAATIAAPRNNFLFLLYFRNSLNWHQVLLKYHLLSLLTFFLRKIYNKNAYHFLDNSQIVLLKYVLFSLLLNFEFVFLDSEYWGLPLILGRLNQFNIT